MRDHHVPNEHHEMELSRVWAVSKLDHSETAGDAPKLFPGDFIFNGNKKLSECFGSFASVVGQ